ncbi:MAG: YitT family protein [Herbinix sp.]|nr:YitT family protein [Herbinix sp.]
MPFKKITYNFTDRNRKQFTPKKIFIIFLGVAICSFGVYNIHLQTNITEGGLLGLNLLLNYWSGISVSILSPLLDILAYALTFKYLGKDFLKFSIVATLCLAGFFRLWEQFPPILPNLSAYPLVAAIAGGLFIGIGVGLIIKQGISASGDDALAMAISKIKHCRISHVYLFTDITVLVLSLTYIPLRRIGFSLVTVIISSLLIEFIQNIGRKQNDTTKLV